MSLYSEKKIRDLCDKYHSLFESRISYITTKQKFNIRLPVNAYNYIFTHNPITPEETDFGCILHSHDGDKTFKSYSMVNKKLDIGQYIFVLAHEFSHWLFFVSENGKKDLDVDQGMEEFFSKIKKEYLFDKFYSYHEVGDFKKATDAEIQSRIDIEEFPVCGLSRMILLTPQDLTYEMKNKNIKKVVAKSQIHDNLVVFFKKKYFIDKDTLFLRLLEEGFIE